MHESVLAMELSQTEGGQHESVLAVELSQLSASAKVSSPWS